MVINEARIKPILTDFSTIMLSFDNNNHNNFGHSGLKYLGSRAKIHGRKVQVLWKGLPDK